MKICRICREVHNDAETYCKVCGEALSRNPGQQSLTNNDIAAIIIFVMISASIVFGAILFFK